LIDPDEAVRRPVAGELIQRICAQQFLGRQQERAAVVGCVGAFAASFGHEKSLN